MEKGISLRMWEAVFIFSASGPLAKARREDRGLGFLLREKDFSFFFGENLLFHQLMQGGFQGFCIGRKGGEVYHFHGLMHESTERSALVFRFIA